MSEVNLNAHLRGMIERFSGYLLSDLFALDEQAAAAQPNASTRSAIGIAAHCAAFNRMIAAILTTGKRPEVTDAERDAFIASITTRELAGAALQQATHDLLAVVDAFPPERWNDDLNGFVGPKMLNAATFSVIHMMYHVGQLNHLHLLQGDTSMHWPGLGG